MLFNKLKDDNMKNLAVIFHFEARLIRQPAFISAVAAETKTKI